MPARLGGHSSLTLKPHSQDPKQKGLEEEVDPKGYWEPGKLLTGRPLPAEKTNLEPLPGSALSLPENPVSAWESFHGLWEHAYTTEETWP